jgi:signal transduction histidine kinase
VAAELSPGDVQALLPAARSVAASRTLAEIGGAVCRAVRGLTGADGVSFAVRDGEWVDHVEEDAVAPLWKSRRTRLDACIAGTVMTQRETIAIADIATETRLPVELYRPTFVRSLAAVPVGPEAAAIGLFWARPAGPSPRAIALAEAIAGFCDVALANASVLAAEIEARRDAEAAGTARDEFLAIIGHQLRNPLAPMLTALHLVKLRGPDPFERERAIIERQVQQVVRIADDLLDISRLTRGEIQLRRHHLEVADVVARAIEVSGPVLEERRLHIAVPTTGLPIDADVDRMTQVVANLIANAAKHTPRSGRIEVTADVESGCARIVVRDDGSGIEAALLPQLFDHMAQRGGGSLGLGLAIVRSLVELHGGVVSAASDGPGRGATFTIRVPLASPDAASASDPA